MLDRSGHRRPRVERPLRRAEDVGGRRPALRPESESAVVLLTRPEEVAGRVAVLLTRPEERAGRIARPTPPTRSRHRTWRIYRAPTRPRRRRSPQFVTRPTPPTWSSHQARSIRSAVTRLRHQRRPRSVHRFLRRDNVRSRDVILTRATDAVALASAIGRQRAEGPPRPQARRDGPRVAAAPRPHPRPRVAAILLAHRHLCSAIDDFRS